MLFAKNIVNGATNNKFRIYKMDESQIPKGSYCYSLSNELNEHGFPKTIICPFFEYKEVVGVQVPFCNFLNLGGPQNGWTEEESEKIDQFYGSREKTDEMLPLFLLWDQVKECGMNDDDESIYG